MPQKSWMSSNRFLRLKRRWIGFWMRHSGLGFSGRFAMRIAKLAAPHYKSAVFLAQSGPAGFISPSAVIQHQDLETTSNVFIGDGSVVYQSTGGGAVTLRRGVRLHSYSVLETGKGGSITIDENTHIQPRCSLSAYKGSIKIGKGVEVAPNCAFYPYNHSIAAGRAIREQPLVSRGDIVVEDEAWLGVGVIVLENVTIGMGAVVGAGSVVTHSIPAGAIAVGNPAKVIGHRSDA